jgi:hypothetical protein
VTTQVAAAWDSDEARAWLAQLAEAGEPRDAECIHRGRNRVWRCAPFGESVIVKRYGASSWWKRSRARWSSSKAERTFHIIAQLRNAALPTPEALAAIDTTEGQMLITREQAHIGTVIDCRGDNTRLTALGAFARRLADAGVQHRDLNAGNVLLVTAEPPSFAIIDCNRIRFRSLSGLSAIWTLLKLGIHVGPDANALLEGYRASASFRVAYRCLGWMQRSWWRIKSLSRPFRRRLGF